jgi:hypothetical protein
MAYTNIDKSDDYFNTVLYTGNETITNIDVGFQPSFVWIKRRNSIQVHALFDQVRGVAIGALQSNSTDTENANQKLVAYTSDGFTLPDTNFEWTNSSGDTFVSWNWLANGAGVSNTDGSITSTVSASTTSGFSVVTWTGTSANATVGHGLTSAPQMIILKNRDSAENWIVGNTSLGWTKYLALNLTDDTTTASNIWQNTAPTSSVFYIGDSGKVNGSGNGIVAYCFAEVKGFSKFGSYVGNGNTDGPFVYTGFKPAFVMIKNASAGSTDWYLYDNKRGGPASGVYGNNNKFFLKPNSSAAEGNESFDMYSNGFKIKISNSFLNGSGNTLIYMAFAEQPFVTSTTNGSIPATAR